MKKKIAVISVIVLAVVLFILSQPITERRTYLDCGFDYSDGRPAQLGCTEKVQYRPGWLVVAVEGRAR